MAMFGEYTMETIGGEVKKQIEYLDSNIRAMSDLLAFGLNDSKFTDLFEASRLISSSIAGVCLAMAVIYAYYAIVKEGLSLRGDWKKVVTILLRLAIAKGLIDISTQFLGWIYSFFAKMSQLAITATTGGAYNGLSDMLEVTDIAKGLNITSDSAPLFDRFSAFLFAKFLGFGFWILGIVLLIIALGRILKIYTLLAVGSVAFAKIPLDGFNSCKEYIRELCALGLQGGVITIAICLFQIACANAGQLISTTSTWGSMGTIVVLAISLILLIFKSEELARKVV